MIASIAPPWMWLAFLVFVVGATLIDLLALKAGRGRVRMREALLWSLIWISLALGFSYLLWLWVEVHFGAEPAHLAATQYLTGYLIEKALSVDNLFVFLMLFRSFSVPAEMQKRALIIGVVGALALRAVMILFGAWLVEQFSWMLYLFGAFLLFTGLKMLLFAKHQPKLEENLVLQWMRKHLALLPDFAGNRLFLRKEGRYWFTPLFVVVVLIGISDVIFAVDSIPAIFAITTDPFIVLTSNVFAVLGLRALYFLLAGMAARFHLLSYGLALVLVFVGVKMLLPMFFPAAHIAIGYALAVIGAILGTTVFLSLMIPDRKSAKK